MVRVTVLLVAGAALWLAARAECAADEVVIQAMDGRVLRGVVDARTDDDRIWVRQEADSIVLVASMPWNVVATASLAGTVIDPAELRARSSSIATTGERGFLNRPVGARQRSESAGPPRLRNVDVLEACLANFDRDVEPDGLVMRVAIVGVDGCPQAVRGNLTAQLFGERRPNDARVVAFPELDRWSQPVAIDDFVDGVATFQLPFRRTAPEWQFDLLPDAVVDVRLGVYGAGNFAASAPVNLRQFNPLRDNRQQQLKSRFFPRELHGRPPTSSPGSPDGLWLHWTW